LLEAIGQRFTFGRADGHTVDAVLARAFFFHWTFIASVRRTAERGICSPRRRGPLRTGDPRSLSSCTVMPLRWRMPSARGT